MNDTDRWAKQLSDERGKKVVFLSHCLLNENTRYLGGACERGAAPTVVRECLDRGYGIVQMPCPEQQAWGGVYKRHLLRYFGSEGTLLYRMRNLVLPILLWYTRVVYRRLARQVVRQIADYTSSGFEVVGIVGVNGSPSCGTAQTMNFRQSLQLVATLTPVASRNDMNAIVLRSLIPGRGLFVEALQRELQRRRLSVPLFAFDLPSELRGQTISPIFKDA
jgi:uncharacterized protein YbbK (DUF523 family)